MYKTSLIFIILLCSAIAQAANYTLEIIQPQEGLTTGTAAQNRYYKNYTGIPYVVPVGVFGGLYPFTYGLTTAPSGMTIDEDTGIITWSSPTTGSHSVVVQVTDAESSTDTASWTLTVDTANAVFLDANTDASGTGTLADPFDSLEDIWGSGGLTTTYDGDFMYFAAGTYTLDGGWWANCPGQQCNVSVNVTAMPHVWIGYEANVIIDHDGGTGNGALGGFLRYGNGCTDVWVSGIKFQDMINHALRMWGVCERKAIYDNTFYNGGPGVDGDNSSFVMFEGTSLESASYSLVKDNTFDTASNWAFFKSYSVNKAVFEGNTFSNPSGSNEGLALKAYDQYVSVRGNFFDGDFSAGSISGNMNNDDEFDISFNRIINADNTFSESNPYGAITINYNETQGRAYIYRNTFEGTVTVRHAITSNGPFYFDNNVIVNENSAVDVPDGSYLTQVDVTDQSRIVVGTGANTNLVGSAADAIIDASGDLTEAYSAYLGTHGYQTTASESTSTGTVTGMTGTGVKIE